MATDKNRINAYVSDTAYEAFQEFRNQYQCSASKAVEILIQKFLLDDVPSNVESNTPSNYVTKEDLDSAILTQVDFVNAALDRIYQRLDKLEHSNAEYVNGSVKEAREIIPTSDDSTDDTPISEQLSSVSSNVECETTSREKDESPIEPDSPHEIEQEAPLNENEDVLVVQEVKAFTEQNNAEIPTTEENAVTTIEEKPSSVNSNVQYANKWDSGGDIPPSHYSEGLTGKELASWLEIDPGSISRWRERIKKKTKPPKGNEEKFAEFERYEYRDDERYYRKIKS